jgi:hypothetical protein
MRITAPFWILLLAGSILAQQSPSNRSQAKPADIQPSSKPGTLEGVVTNSVNGEPVKKATVTLRNIGQQFGYQAVTDAAGAFHFERVDPGTYDVSATLDGFINQQPGYRSSYRQKPIALAEEQNVKDVAIKLMPLATVQGHVLDADGDPIANAMVRGLHYVYQRGKKQLQPWGYAQANDLGEFEMMNLQPGRYYFQASAQVPLFFPPRTRYRHPQEAYPVTYYPNGSDPSQASATEVSYGAHVTNIDFRLRKAPAFHIRGKIVDGETGQISRTMIVRLEPQGLFSAVMLPMARPEQDGSFDIGQVVSGSYYVTSQRTSGDATASARQPVTVVNQDLNGVMLSHVPNLEISGKLNVEGPAPDHFGAQIVIRPATLYGVSFQAAADPDGNFTLHNVIPASYLLDVMGRGSGIYIKSIRFGDHAIDDGQLDLTSRPAGTLAITFATNGGQVLGSVQTKNGEPAPNISVTIAPAQDFEGRRDLFKQAFADQTGNFRFQDLAPGDYKVFAWESADVNLVQNSEFRRAFESQAVSINIGPSSRETVQLKVISADDFEREKNKLP